MYTVSKLERSCARLESALQGIMYLSGQHRIVRSVRDVNEERAQELYDFALTKITSLIHEGRSRAQTEPVVFDLLESKLRKYEEQPDFVYRDFFVHLLLLKKKDNESPDPFRSIRSSLLERLIPEKVFYMAGENTLEDTEEYLKDQLELFDRQGARFPTMFESIKTYRKKDIMYFIENFDEYSYGFDADIKFRFLNLLKKAAGIRDYLGETLAYLEQQFFLFKDQSGKFAGMFESLKTYRKKNIMYFIENFDEMLYGYDDKIRYEFLSLLKKEMGLP